MRAVLSTTFGFPEGAAYTLAGDANLDGAVDTIDFNLLAANFGHSLAAGFART